MGQRTAFLIKRTYWNGKVNIRLVHHQWGIGRVMHNHFIKSFMEEPAYYKLLKKETSKAIKKDCQNHNKVAINNNGNVSLCIEALSYDIEPLGNCKNNSFEEIWERRWNNILFQPRNREESQCGNCKYKTFCDSGCKIDAYVKSFSVNAPAIPNCRACH